MGPEHSNVCVSNIKLCFGWIISTVRLFFNSIIPARPLHSTRHEAGIFPCAPALGNPHPHVNVPPPRTFSTTLLLTVAFVAAPTSSCTPSLSETNLSRVVVTVDGTPIVVPELRHFMDLHRPAVYNPCLPRTRRPLRSRLLDHLVRRGDPLNVLKRRALNETVHHKVQKNLARDLGISAPFHYDSLMTARTRSNLRRARAEEPEAAVYGSVHRTRRDYLSQLRDEIVRKSIAMLSQTDFSVLHSRLKALYAIRTSQNAQAEARGFDAFASVYQRRHAQQQYEARRFPRGESRRPRRLHRPRDRPT